jgi:uncharacterized protein YbbK (DUF523 family)
MTFLLANWRWVLIGLLIASTGLFYKLWREDVRAFNAYKIEVAALGKAAEMEKARIETEHAKTTKEIKDAIPKKIAAARSNAVANYLASLPAHSGSCGVSGAANGSGGANGSGEESIPASGAFIQDCAQDAATVGLFQEWIRGIGFPVK